jgi:hypothetical protein
MNDLINILNVSVDFIKRVFGDIFINKNAKIYDSDWVYLWSWFLYFTLVYANAYNIDILINQRLKYNNKNEQDLF